MMTEDDHEVAACLLMLTNGVVFRNLRVPCQFNWEIILLLVDEELKLIFGILQYHKNMLIISPCNFNMLLHFYKTPVFNMVFWALTHDYICRSQGSYILCEEFVSHFQHFT